MNKNKQTTIDILDCTTCNALSKDSIYVDDQIILEINDIDDLAIAWIVTENSDEDINNELKFTRIEEDKEGKIVPLHNTQWVWGNLGKHGSGKANITQWLNNHIEELLPKKQILYLVVAIYDFPYDKWISAGKWSFDASLTINGQVYWHKHDFGKSDTSNGIYGYGLKYLKIIKLTLNNIQSVNNRIDLKEYKVQFSEVIPKDIASEITNTIKKKYNFTKKEDLEKQVSSVFKDTEEKKNSRIPFLLYLLDLNIILLFLVLYYRDKAIPFIQNYIYASFDILDLFIFSNIVLLLNFFFGYKLGGMAWALVLKKKHNKELDTFMVVLGLLFTAAFGAITSFDFEAENLTNTTYIVSIFSLYLTTNFVLLYILTVVSTYAINTLEANKPMVFVLIALIGFGIFIQEVINFEQNYKENIPEVKLYGEKSANKK